LLASNGSARIRPTAPRNTYSTRHYVKVRPPAAKSGLPDRSARMDQAASEGFAEPLLEVINSGRRTVAGH
jgi:hypothetical protein